MKVEPVGGAPSEGDASGAQTSRSSSPQALPEAPHVCMLPRERRMQSSDLLACISFPLRR